MPNLPLWSASSTARTFLLCGSNLRTAMPPICPLGNQSETYSQGVEATKPSLTQAEPHRYKRPSGQFARVKQGPLGFRLGTWSLYFSGSGHTCHRYHPFRVLSSSFPDKAFITVSGVVVVNLGCTLESPGATYIPRVGEQGPVSQNL